MHSHEGKNQMGMIAPRPAAASLPPALVHGLGLLALGLMAAAIATQPFRILSLAAGLLLVLGLGLRRPELVLYPLLLSVPFPLVEVEFDGASASSTEGLVATLVLAWLATAVARRELRLEGGAILAAMLWVLAAMLVSLPVAPSLSLAAKETLKWLEALVVFLFVAANVRDRVAVQRVLLVAVVAGVAESLYALYELARGTVPASFAIGSVVRASGTFGQPNPFGGYVGTLLPLAVVLALVVRPLPGRLVLGLGAGIITLAVLASQSRGAWLGVSAAAVAGLLVWSHRSRLLFVPAAYGAAVVAVLALLGLVPAEVLARLGTIAEYFGIFDVRQVPLTPENWAVVERMAHWQAGWGMFLDSPWLGVGPGNYPVVYDRYFLPGWVDPLGHAHNLYLNMAAETGLAGLVGLLGLLVAAYARALGALLGAPAARPGEPTRWPGQRHLALGLLASLVVFTIHNLFDNLLVHGMSVQFGLLLGLIHVCRPSSAINSQGPALSRDPLAAGPRPAHQAPGAES